MRLKLLEAKTQRVLATAADAYSFVNLQRAVSVLKLALYRPKRAPFDKELMVLRATIATGQWPVARAVVDTMDDHVAAEGVSTAKELKERFEGVKEEVRKASLVPENGGFVSHAISRVFSKAMFPKSVREGSDVEAILTRAEDYVFEGDFELAARELNQLAGWPKQLVKDWVEETRRYLEAQQALKVLETECFLQSLRFG